MDYQAIVAVFDGAIATGATGWVKGLKLSQDEVTKLWNWEYSGHGYNSLSSENLDIVDQEECTTALMALCHFIEYVLQDSALDRIRGKRESVPMDEYFKKIDAIEAQVAAAHKYAYLQVDSQTRKHLGANPEEQLEKNQGAIAWAKDRLKEIEDKHAVYEGLEFVASDNEWKDAKFTVTTELNNGKAWDCQLPNGQYFPFSTEQILAYLQTAKECRAAEDPG